MLALRFDWDILLIFIGGKNFWKSSKRRQSMMVLDAKSGLGGEGGMHHRAFYPGLVHRLGGILLAYIRLYRGWAWR